MLPGPDIVFACPQCGALSKVFSLLSGNTLGAARWTDGKMIAPMLPHPPEVAKCHACQLLFWTFKAQKIGQVKGLPSADQNIPPAWLNAPSISELSAEDYFIAIDKKMWGCPAEEKRLRLLTWWRCNDYFRQANVMSASDATSPRGMANMRRMLDLLDYNSEEERVLKAELSRELGRFDDARILLDTITKDAFFQIKTFLLELCAEKTTSVKPIPEPPWLPSDPPIPCPYCGKPLPSSTAKLCLHCGLDWHNPDKVVRRKH